MVKLVTSEPERSVAQALWTGWLADGAEIYAPMLLPFEAVSAVRKQAQRGLLSAQLADAAKTTLLHLFDSVRFVEPQALLEGAWKLAQTYGLTVVYDASYVALAEQKDAILWTGDGRMLRAMPQHAGRIRTLNPTP